MALPIIIAALLGKAAVGAASKAVAGKAAAGAAKAAASHHGHGVFAKEVVVSVKDRVTDEVVDKGTDKARGWWSRGTNKDAETKR